MTTELEPDGRIWNRARGGDEAAFEAIFDRHSGRVYNFCYRALGSWDQAEEQTAIVFLQAWRRRSQVEAERDSVLPWLLNIANHCVRNEQRSRRRHARLLGRLQEARPLVQDDGSASVDAAIDRAGQATQLAQVLKQLRPNDQQVLRLFYFGELTVEQTAQALEIPLGTAKSRLSRARGHLRDLLAPPPSHVPQKAPQIIEEAP